MRRAPFATVGVSRREGFRISSLDPTDILVMVGDGRKAHVFRSGAGVDYNLAQLRDGATVYDVALCGTGGPMMLAAEERDVCGHCSNKLEREVV